MRLPCRLHPELYKFLLLRQTFFHKVKEIAGIIWKKMDEIVLCERHSAGPRQAAILGLKSASFFQRIRIKSPGFSILEVLVVLTIMVALSALALPLLEMTVVRARERVLRDSLRDTRLAIDRYRRERNSSISPFYPISVASLLEPIPDTHLKPGGQPGPFLHKLPEHSFLGESPIFLWDIRDASGAAWVAAVNNASQQFNGGVFDIRVPVTKMGGWETALDGSKYEFW